jgi:hypothetical protein
MQRAPRAPAVGNACELAQLLHFKRRRRMELEHWIDFKDFVPDPKNDDEVADQVAWETPR